MFKTLECRSPAVFGLYQQNRDQIVGNLSLQGEKNVQKTYKCIYSVNNFLSCIDVQCKKFSGDRKATPNNSQKQSEPEQCPI